jgi:hypothetical protein
MPLKENAPSNLQQGLTYSNGAHAAIIFPEGDKAAPDKTLAHSGVQVVVDDIQHHGAQLTAAGVIRRDGLQKLNRPTRDTCRSTVRARV